MFNTLYINYIKSYKCLILCPVIYRRLFFFIVKLCPRPRHITSLLEEIPRGIFYCIVLCGIAVGKYARRPLFGWSSTIAGVYARQRFKPSCASET